MPQSNKSPKLLIKSVRLRRIRCFEDVTIDFWSSENVRSWTTILGNNGLGKTTLLRCLALGLCDSSSAAALERELYGELIRNNTPDNELSSIEIELIQPGSKQNVSIKTLFKKDESGYAIVTQELIPERDFPWNEIFVCGYGAARRAFETRDLSEYGIVDAVYTLFNYDAALQNPELVLRRLSSVSRQSLEAALHRVDDILLLPKGSTKLNTSGLTVDGPWGSFMPVGSLGDGYQATMAWILDFIGQAMLFEPKNLGRNLSGIVLLDEIEQHLHPNWQREIVRRLSRQFPKVQFVCTSHSPLCAGGIADMPRETIQLLALYDEGESGIQVIEIDPPKGLRIDQIVTSLAFGVSSSRSLGTEERLIELRNLNSITNRSPQQKRRLRKIYRQLENEEPEVAEDEEDRQLRKELRDLLQELQRTISE